MISEETKQEFRKLFGEQINVLRNAKGLTYRKVAENCDLDYSYISKIAKGETNITLETVLELLKGLDAQPHELFNFGFDLKEIDKE